MNILVSACLLGIPCRYDGSDKEILDVVNLKEKHNLIPICPEELGGLTTPRDPSEIRDGKVYSKMGIDVTKEFEAGARKILEIAKEYHCELAILKERSPSCGYGKVYDGTFQGKLVDGSGKAAELLAKEGIKVIGESKVKDLSL
ncbi:DUF523 domain-containing protein [Anaeromicropila herbilytica]|uniref:Purine-nucleoside phosphorylase n=1 Tax=Anaeromicropila herbilytica TaxID=2785025 RepID=A0A7R7EKZ4_9FIRM|nr:DUF523 domain-containing protein [Anaeromicropila herbilytica]BCN30673.1 hypothetical protein bsdtb5_19680 [Anaeromicropila herbilytica]